MTDTLVFIDDDTNLLDFYQDVFDDDFQVHTFPSGPEALEWLKKHPTPSVIVSDMAMPQLNGVQTLTQAKEVSPDSIRIMLTGESSEDVAISAVNEGEVFKFLTKPASVDSLVSAIGEGMQAFQFIQAEKRLLQQTLQGSVEVMIEALSISSPAVFGLAQKMNRDVRSILELIDKEVSWELNAASLLSQIGVIAATDAILSKLGKPGDALTDEEYQSYVEYARTGADLLRRVPRLGSVADIVLLQHKHYDGSGFPEDITTAGDDLPFGARLLHVINDYHRNRQFGLTRTAAVELLATENSRYDPALVEVLQRFVAIRNEAASEASTLEEVVHISSLVPGMVLAEDLYNKEGALLMRRGQEVSKYIAEKLHSFARGDAIDQYVRVNPSSADAATDSQS